MIFCHATNGLVVKQNHIKLINQAFNIYLGQSKGYITSYILLYNYYLIDLFVPEQVFLGKVRVEPGEEVSSNYSLLVCKKVNSTLTFPSASNWYIKSKAFFCISF